MKGDCGEVREEVLLSERMRVRLGKAGFRFGGGEVRRMSRIWAVVWTKHNVSNDLII